MLRTELEKAQNVFLTGYEKLTVQQDFEIISKYGADTGRVFILFVGPPEQAHGQIGRHP